MVAAFIPYLQFQGQCAEAFAFYGRVFGAEPVTMRFSDAPPGANAPSLPEGQQGWIMHAQISTPGGGTLMGCDAPPQFGGQPQAGVSVSVWDPDAGRARAMFDQLAEGGTVTMPFAATFFAPGFGMCRDRFGTAWMVSVPGEQPAAA